MPGRPVAGGAFGAWGGREGGSWVRPGHGAGSLVFAVGAAVSSPPPGCPGDGVVRRVFPPPSLSSPRARAGPGTVFLQRVGP